jgi:hypothetical protein
LHPPSISIPIEPAEPGARLSRVRSLKAFGRRPIGLGASGKLCERAGSPKPVTNLDSCAAAKKTSIEGDAKIVKVAA